LTEQSAIEISPLAPKAVLPERLSARHIRSLDGLRGIAFLLIFVRHYAVSGHLSSKTMRFVENAGSAGWMGVDLFFTLSGFLITGILLDTRDQPHYFRNFYARRALRIFPLYYGFFFVLLLLTPFVHLQWRPGHIAYLFYAGNLAGNLDSSLTQIKPAVEMLHFWSLAVEEQFYLIWPFLVLAIGSRKTLVRTCFALSAVGLLLRIAIMVRFPQTGAEWTYAQLPTHMDGLLAGALAAIWFRELPLQAILARVRWLLPISAVILAVIIAYSGHPNFNSFGMTVLGFPVLAVFFACILLLSLKPGTLSNRIGSVSFLRFVGKYSYGMYIFHYVFSPATGPYLPVLQAHLHSIVLGGLAYVAIAFLGTLLLAVASYNLYERHWLRLKSKFSYSTSNRDAAAIGNQQIIQQS
jgi:peptidoglycan/LPS O-acetylase OafA/YrhL